MTKEYLMHWFEVNALGPLRMTRAFLPNLRLTVKANGTAFVAQSSVIDTIASNFDSINTESDSNNARFEYLAEKARIDQEEAKARRATDLKRKEAEVVRDERRHTMDKERDDRQQQLVLKVMDTMSMEEIRGASDSLLMFGGCNPKCIVM